VTGLTRSRIRFEKNVADSVVGAGADDVDVDARAIGALGFADPRVEIAERALLTAQAVARAALSDHN
jgi:hypothetical protein